MIDNILKVYLKEIQGTAENIVEDIEFKEYEYLESRIQWILQLSKILRENVEEIGSEKKEMETQEILLPDYEWELIWGVMPDFSTDMEDSIPRDFVKYGSTQFTTATVKEAKNKATRIVRSNTPIFKAQLDQWYDLDKRVLARTIYITPYYRYYLISLNRDTFR